MITSLLFSVLNVICFYLGFRLGKDKSNKTEARISTPFFEPIGSYPDPSSTYDGPLAYGKDEWQVEQDEKRKNYPDIFKKKYE